MVDKMNLIPGGILAIVCISSAFSGVYQWVQLWDKPSESPEHKGLRGVLLALNAINTRLLYRIPGDSVWF